MEHKFKYGTVSQAFHSLRANGFDKDFQLIDNKIVCNEERFQAEDLKIIVIYRYEGNSDPGDEATVYGLESKNGLKGILVTADGIYSDKDTPSILQKLHIAKNKLFQQPVYKL